MGRSIQAAQVHLQYVWCNMECLYVWMYWYMQ